MRELEDDITNEKKMILVGYSRYNNAQTAQELIPFKNGRKLSDRIVTCINCSPGLSIGIIDALWGCKIDDATHKTCRKIEKLESF